MMDFSDGFVSKEHRELHQSASESADPSAVFPLQISSRSPRSPPSSRSPRMHGKYSEQSPKHDKQSRSQRDGRPKKGKISLIFSHKNATHYIFDKILFETTPFVYYWLHLFTIYQLCSVVSACIIFSLKTISMFHILVLDCFFSK